MVQVDDTSSCANGVQVYAYDLRNEGLILTTPAEEYEFNDDEINSVCVSTKNTKRGY